MLLIIIRTLILFIVVGISLKIMGKHQVGQLQPYELVIIILLADMTVTPMANTGIPLLWGIVPVLILVMAQVILSYLTMKSNRARKFICGTPVVLVENGKLVEKEMRKLRYNINDLLEQLRDKNIYNIADVEFAILETSGKLSVIPKSQKRPVTPDDLELPTKYEGLPITLIVDGSVMHDNLRKCNLSEEWLKNELKKFGINGTKEVFFASLDTQGRLFYQKKES